MPRGVRVLTAVGLVAFAGGLALAFGRGGDGGPSRAEYLAEIGFRC